MNIDKVKSLAVQHYKESVGVTLEYPEIYYISPRACLISFDDADFYVLGLYDFRKDKYRTILLKTVDAIHWL